MRMIRIRFVHKKNEKRALGFLARRFSFKTFATGESIVPETALGALASEGISFTVEGPATYEQLVSTFRNASSRAV